MNEINIKVQVHCPTCASWISYENNIYRLYVNDDLLTERTWIWGCDTVIDEEVIVRLELGNHTIRLDPIYKQRSIVKFGLRNLRINNWNFNNKNDELLELPFLLETHNLIVR